MNPIETIASAPHVRKTIEQYIVEEEAAENKKYKNTISEIHIADALTHIDGPKALPLPAYNDFKINQLSAALTGMTVVAVRRSHSLGVDIFLRDDEDDVYVLKNGLLCTGVNEMSSKKT